MSARATSTCSRTSRGGRRPEEHRRHPGGVGVRTRLDVLRQRTGLRAQTGERMAAANRMAEHPDRRRRPRRRQRPGQRDRIAGPRRGPRRACARRRHLRTDAGPCGRRRRRGRTSVSCAPTRSSCRFATRPFDAAVSLAVLQLIPNPTATLAEIVRVLQPGGRVAIMVPTAGRGGGCSAGCPTAESTSSPKTSSATHSRISASSACARRRSATFNGCAAEALTPPRPRAEGTRFEP